MAFIFQHTERLGGSYPVFSQTPGPWPISSFFSKDVSKKAACLLPPLHLEIKLAGFSLIYTWVVHIFCLPHLILIKTTSSFHWPVRAAIPSKIMCPQMAWPIRGCSSQAGLSSACFALWRTQAADHRARFCPDNLPSAMDNIGKFKIAKGAFGLFKTILFQDLNFFIH